jgi:hypothetical protein
MSMATWAIISATDAALDHRPNECPRTEKALLSTPCWSTNEVGKDVGGTTEGIHLHEQLCSQTKSRIRQNTN